MNVLCRLYEVYCFFKELVLGKSCADASEAERSFREKIAVHKALTSELGDKIEQADRASLRHLRVAEDALQLAARIRQELYREKPK
jgi:hypothetical protein